MSIIKLIDDYLVEFGNERFLEGWNGATERIIKLLETELLSDDDTAWQTRDWQEVERQQDRDWVIKEAIALIKGENK